jgi:hypothetical protein
MQALSGSELMKALKLQYPDASIEEVLDKARLIGLEQIFFEIRDLTFETPVHIIEELCDRSLTCEDAITVLKLMADYNDKFRFEINQLIDSHSVETIYKFFQLEISNPPQSCCMRLRRTSNIRRRNQQPLRTSP